jgi:hypothetical protein
LGFPSGPSSSRWATISGAFCACDAEAINCIAVSAVVASSTKRSFVMMILIPPKALASSGDKQIDVRPHCGGAFYLFMQQ